MQDSWEPPDDEELLDLVKSVMSEVAAVPHAVTEAARVAFELRTIDIELAALIYDSRVDDRLLAGSRAAGSSARILVFRTDEATVEVEFRDGRALGQIDPPSGGLVSFESPQRRLGEAEIDSFGCFVIEGDFAGVIRVILHGRDEAKLVTEWARL